MADTTSEPQPHLHDLSQSVSPAQSGAGFSDLPKLPPCDQCRRRKVKCDGRKVPCDRCVQSHLSCTRDIARKKRGPKKGSGSVIAKLRDEHEHGMSQETGLPPFDLSQLEQQIPSLRRTWSNESGLTSPLTSPIGSSFGELYPPTSDPTSMPRSIPPTLQNGTGLDTIPPAAFGQGDVQFPSSWQVPGSDLLQFGSPGSPTGYMTVNDLAQQIFQETPGMAFNTFGPSFESGPSRTDTPISRPGSIGDMLTTGTAPSPSAAGSSPMPSYGPKFLYRSDSGILPIESRLMSLAVETGMSAYLLSQCMKQYWRHLYPIMPVLHEPTLSQRLNQQDELTTAEKTLVLSICAVVVVHAAPQSDLSVDKKLQLGNQLIETCIHMRKAYDWIEYSSLSDIIVSYHFAVALFELKKPRSHHFYLQEAVSMAHEQGLHRESTYLGLDTIQSICARRTFALLFITERGLAILRNKHTGISKLPYLPSEYFDEHDRRVLAGFSSLANLFSILDEKFVDLWRSNPGDASTEPHDNIAGIQHNLNKMTFDTSALTEIQKADVLITHQWLRLIFWQAAMRQGLISSNAPEPIFYYNYPIVIAKDLCLVMQDLTFEAILVHGLGIFEKLFEAAYTLMDALTIAKLNWSDSEELRYLFSVLAASPNSNSTYVRMLENKMATERSPVNSPNGKKG